LSLPTEILEKTCFVVNRDEDPIDGFQRELDVKRAQDIANYIDKGLGTIPSAIILSAQEDAEIDYKSRGKSISFMLDEKAFLIIDGQHRVYGFILAKKALRVPVIIYNGLSKRDETRLFIDVNSKQRGVPPELLLDIKKMADYESTQEEFLRAIFDLFNSESDSYLYGKLSPASKSKGKITRSTFNTAMKPLIKNFGGKSEYDIYSILNSYLIAFDTGVLSKHDLFDQIVNTTFFKAVCGLFPLVAGRVKDRYGAIYDVDNFYEFTVVVGANTKKSALKPKGSAYKPLLKILEASLKDSFEL